jgi:pimeloyl-ACP methyl ester carboxylesterase
MKIALVHGLGVSHRYFSRLREQLPCAAAPDLAGDSIELLTQSLEHAVEGSTLLVGHSVGCQVAVELAVRRPDLVGGLVLMGATWDPASPTIAGQLWRLANGSYREPPSLLPVLAADYLRWGPRRILRTARSMLRHPMTVRLAEVAQPVLVLRGERDSICGEGWAETAASASGGRLVVVPGAAHAVQWSHPRVVAQLIEELQQQIGKR